MISRSFNQPLVRAIFSALLGLGLGLAAINGAHADSKAGSGGAACKAPWGEPFGLGETIQVTETDAHGNFVKVTYQCTENGWTKVSSIGPSTGGHRGINMVPGKLQRQQ